MSSQFRYWQVALLVVAVVLAPTVSSDAARHHRPVHVRLAPADEYFGRQKMSILEIHNRLSDLTVRAADSRNAANVMHDSASTEDAMRDWERKYPGDPWLAKDYAELAHIYARVHTPTGRAKMRATLAWLQSRHSNAR